MEIQPRDLNLSCVLTSGPMRCKVHETCFILPSKPSFKLNLCARNQCQVSAIQSSSCKCGIVLETTVHKNQVRICLLHNIRNIKLRIFRKTPILLFLEEGENCVFSSGQRHPLLPVFTASSENTELPTCPTSPSVKTSEENKAALCDTHTNQEVMQVQKDGYATALSRNLRFLSL
jgi:hypothetical protein